MYWLCCSATCGICCKGAHILSQQKSLLKICNHTIFKYIHYKTNKQKNFLCVSVCLVWFAFPCVFCCCCYYCFVFHVGSLSILFWTGNSMPTAYHHIHTLQVYPATQIWPWSDMSTKLHVCESGQAWQFKMLASICVGCRRSKDI